VSYAAPSREPASARTVDRERASKASSPEGPDASTSGGTDWITAERVAGGGAKREWSLSRMRIRPPSKHEQTGASLSNTALNEATITKSHALATYPHQRQIEMALGTQVPGQAIVDPAGCKRCNALAFTENQVAHFGTERPSLEVAGHEAVHLLQHAGITRDVGLGPERHACTVARAMTEGGSARHLVSASGSAVQSGVRPYTEVPVAAQTATEWDAKMPLRLAEDGRMAVGQDRAMHSFWAESSLIAQSNTILASRKSVIRLLELSDKIGGSAPSGAAARSLSNVSAQNAATATQGDAMNIWADCGKSARDVMGAGEGTGENYEKMTASFRAREKPPKWIRYIGGVAVLLSGTPQLEKRQTVASLPKAMKKEIFNAKLGGSGDEGLRTYNALSPAEKEAFDKETGINRFAAPETGQGYTMSSGGADVPDKTTWNFHWAGVVMHSGSDRVTLENYSIERPTVRNTKWEFQMYGSAAKADQTFYEQHKATGQHGQAPTAMQVEKR
jgi:hypothetical protein